MASYSEVINAVRRWTPLWLHPLARSAYFRLIVPLEIWSVSMADRLQGRTYDGRTLPPAMLRFKVRGSPSGEAFARIGRACATDIASALARFGRSLGASRSILDFGCGCGGTLLWLRELAPSASISGTDIDAEAIEWCRANLAFGRFGTNGSLPPLPYADGSFDLVYAISVFTHLDEQFQHRWLAELRRIVAPGGTCLVTLHGPDSWKEMGARDREALARSGFVFVRTDTTRGLFPDWYQTAFHTQAYVESTFTAYFDVLGFIPKGLSGHQDVAVLGRRLTDGSP